MEHVVSVVAAATPAGAAAADVVLLPGRAAWLPASATLLVADLHLGKAATFRRAGIPVPEGSARRDLLRLATLVAGSAARRLVILGDLFHARTGCTPAVRAEFAAIRARFADTEVWLALGNHDRQLGRLPPGTGIDAAAAEFVTPPFLLVHDPAAARPGLFTVAGHVHPTVTVSAPSGDRLTDRCFVATADALVLPAFGSFTGGHRVAPAPGARLWLARDDGLVEVTRLAAAGAGRRH